MADKPRPIRLKDLWNVPNAFTISRLFLAIPLPFLVIYASWHYAVGYMWVVSATDYFDGKLARWFNKVTGIGEVLDIVIDRAITTPVIIAFLYVKGVEGSIFVMTSFFVFIVIVLLGEILVLVGIFLFARMKRENPLLIYPSPPFVAKFLFFVQLVGLSLLLSPLPQHYTATYLLLASAYNLYAASVFFFKGKWIFMGDVEEGMKVKESI